MKKVFVDKNVCIGCGACCGVAPDVFTIGDDGLSEVRENADLKTNQDEMEQASEICPVDAIKIEKEEK